MTYSLLLLAALAGPPSDTHRSDPSLALPSLALPSLAPPSLAPPSLIPRSAQTVQAGWEWVKLAKDRQEQLERIGERKLTHSYCTDTLDAQELLRVAPDLPYELRDWVRSRHAARPEMVALMVRAMGYLKRWQPGSTITIGDIAQRGCGQIRYGTIVHFDDDAETFLRRSRLEFGLPTVTELLDSWAFSDEFPRMDDLDTPIRVEQTASGRTRDGQLRVETRRFSLGAHVTEHRLSLLLDRTSKRFKDKSPGAVQWDLVDHDDGRGAVRLKRGTYFDSRTGVWAELILRPGVKGAFPMRPDRIARIREAYVDLGKPTSLKFEERWDFDFDGEAGVHVTRWFLEYEAHHASHLSGLDADLSYVTFNNYGHFSPLLALMDRVGSWRWMKALEKAARDLAIPLDALFVDPTVLRALKTVEEARKAEPAWKKLKRSPGHDSHVHVRIRPAPRFHGKTLTEIIEMARL